MRPKQIEQRYERSERRKIIIGNYTFRFDFERYRFMRGAGSVVTKDVPDNAVVVGNPARVIKYPDADEFQS